MSPEQVRREPVSAQSDLFSLGVVAYELLTGHHPFHGHDIESIEQQILGGTPLRLSRWRSDLPDIYQRIIDKALARDSRHRHRTGLDLAADIALVYDFLKLPKFSLTQQEKFHQIEDLHFFKGFPDGELWELINAAEWIRLPEGIQIMREGQSEAAFFVLIEGEVAVRRNRREIVRLHAGDCFGEMGMLARRPRSATIIAMTDVTVIKIRDTTIDRMSMNCQLRFQRQFLIALIERLDHASDRIVSSPDPE